MSNSTSKEAKGRSSSRGFTSGAAAPNKGSATGRTVAKTTATLTSPKSATASQADRQARTAKAAKPTKAVAEQKKAAPARAKASAPKNAAPVAASKQKSDKPKALARVSGKAAAAKPATQAKAAKPAKAATSAKATKPSVAPVVKAVRGARDAATRKAGKASPSAGVAAKPERTAVGGGAKGRTEKPSAVRAAKATVLTTPTASPAPVTPRRKPSRSVFVPKAAPPPKVRHAHVPKPPSMADAIKAYETALKAFNRGNFAVARESFEKIVQRFGNHPEIVARVNTYLSICKTRLQTPDRAPQTVESFYDRGVMELNRGNYESAIELFKRALRSQPQMSHVLYSLAAAQIRAGMIDEGLTSLEQAVEVREIHRSHARSDPDFAAVRSDLRFQQLVDYYL